MCAAVIPKPYQTLKTQLCCGSDSELWARLSKTSLSESVRNTIVQDQTPVLMVARARIEHLSLCDSSVSHQTAEISEGFAPLFQYINGTTCVSDILTQLAHAGATEPMLESIKAGFARLLNMAMLVH